MTEQPGSGPPEVALSGQDLLLATKLHVPRPQPGFVPRPRLTGRLDEGLARGFVLVCAPAGYGKTALLADWAAASSGRKGQHRRAIRAFTNYGLPPSRSISVSRLMPCRSPNSSSCSRSMSSGRTRNASSASSASELARASSPGAGQRPPKQ
jgi:hypothetical protein